MQTFRQSLEGLQWAQLSAIVDNSPHIGHVQRLASSRLKKIAAVAGADSSYKGQMSLSTRAIAEAALNSVLRLHEISPLQMPARLADAALDQTVPSPTHLGDTDHAVRIEHLERDIQKFQRDTDWKHADSRNETDQLKTEVREYNADTLQKTRDLNQKMQELQSSLNRVTEARHAEEIIVLQQQVTGLQKTMRSIKPNPNVAKKKASVPPTQSATGDSAAEDGPSTAQVLQLLAEVIQQTVTDKTKTDAKIASVLSAIERTDKVNSTQVALVSSKADTVASDVSALTRELAIVRLDALQLKQQATIDHVHKEANSSVAKPGRKKASSSVAKPVHKEASSSVAKKCGLLPSSFSPLLDVQFEGEGRLLVPPHDRVEVVVALPLPHLVTGALQQHGVPVPDKIIHNTYIQYMKFKVKFKVSVSVSYVSDLIDRHGETCHFFSVLSVYTYESRHTH